MEEKKQFWKGLTAGLGIALAMAVVIFLVKGTAGSSGSSEGVDLTNSRVEKKLQSIEKLINESYLDEVDAQQVEDYLYKGAIAGLGDLYAAYYTEEEYQSMLESTNGSYCGIGVEVTQDRTTGFITVTRVFEDSPAEEAGILAGDVLYKVGDTEVLGEDLNMVVSMIKGEEYTKVTLTVERDGEYLELESERRIIESTTVEYQMLENQIGYLAITSFEEVTTTQFETAMDDLEAQGMQALIVDLRDNGGGLVSSVCTILDRLLPEGLIVYTEDKNGNRVEKTSDAEHYFDKPMVVLVNGNSASASEIFAGAIKDYGIGTLVGTTTFGKGIVQNIYALGDGTAVKLTVSKYYTPNGNNIHGIGIEPDVEVEAEEDSDTDVQLQKALEILEE